jgi:hypothetical protein
MLDQAMSFDEFALICTYSVISVLSQIKFFLDFPDALSTKRSPAQPVYLENDRRYTMLPSI